LERPPSLSLLPLHFNDVCSFPLLLFMLLVWLLLMLFVRLHLHGHHCLFFSPPYPFVSFSIHTFLQTWVDICFNVLVVNAKQLQFIFINIYDNVFVALLVVALCLQMLTSSFWAFCPSLFGHMFEANTLFLLVSYFVHPNSPLKTTSFLSFFICLSLYIETHHFFSHQFFS
jgi:hypothetical protein